MIHSCSGQRCSWNGGESRTGQTFLPHAAGAQVSVGVTDILLYESLGPPTVPCGPRKGILVAAEGEMGCLGQWLGFLGWRH